MLAGERLRLEREALGACISPETHSNVRKQLMDLQVTHRANLEK